MSLSVSAAARLQRQRRLQSCSPANRTVTPSSIKQRSIPKHKQTSSNDDALGKGLANTSMSCSSFDEEEVTAATTAASDNSTPSSLTKQGRSFSFSDFSVPFPSVPSEEAVTSLNMTYDAATTTTTGTTNAATVTPPGSPGRSRSFQHQGRSHPSTRIPSPISSFGALGEPRHRALLHNRPRITRNNSSSSMPHVSGSPKRLLSLTNESHNSHDSGDDMPMDELMHSDRGIRSRSRPPVGLLTAGPISSTTHADTTSFNTTTTTTGSSSTALVLSTSAGSSSNLHRMAQALRTRTRPAYMTTEEKHLWDVIQSLLPYNNTNSSCTSSSSEVDGTDWEQLYHQREAEWKQQEEEHDRAIRAIQRVLSDVTTERDQTVEHLKEELERSQQVTDISPETSSNNEKEEDNDKVKELLETQLQELKKVNATLEHELENKENKMISTERSLQIAKLALKKQANPAMRDTLLLELQDENEEKTQQIAELKKQLLSYSSDEDMSTKMEETIASLENAKMIIASLENANGSLAQDLRAKLKLKEEELERLTSTSAERKKTLDTLATELRELQNQLHQPNITNEQLDKQREFCKLLEKNVKILRQAAVQHEARNDQTSVENISQIVGETFKSLKQNLESWETYLRNAKASAGAVIAGDRHLEVALSKKVDETKVLRKELERVRTESNQETSRLHQEIMKLREQLSANMEILAQKGRELSVLRDSLNLDDNGVGYISDDGTECYDAEPEPVSSPKGAVASTALTIFDGGNPNAAEISDAAAAEIQMLKNELVKAQKEREAKASELQAEKESLANAKMIISSLEKANKSMLEDLRSRLQDSNTAIASLLEKSMEHEKSTMALRKELEEVKAERKKDEEKSKAELAKLRDENLVFSMRLASKDRELEELQDTLSNYEGTEVQMKMTVSSVEEKKEDPAIADE